SLLEQHGVASYANPPSSGNSTLLTVLLSFGPTILLVVAFLYLSRRMAATTGGAFGFGQSRARLYNAERPATTFKDVAGIDQAAPAIIFIDELDAIGRSRGAAIRTGGNDEQEQTLNQILTEMDGFDSREGVIVLAATNRADVLDPALLRPGRFDRRVMVQAPDRNGRLAILRIHTRGVPLAPDVDLEALAAQAAGFVGADLRNLVNEAALLAARREREAVTMGDFTDSIEKVLLGAERHIMLTPADRQRIAYH